jgi:hypothetical protein
MMGVGLRPSSRESAGGVTLGMVSVACALAGQIRAGRRAGRPGAHPVEVPVA